MPSPFTEHIFIPEEPKKELKTKKDTKKISNLKALVLQSRDGLTPEELQELTPLEMKKYKTRTMLNEILSSKDVSRKTASPWQVLQNACQVNKIIKLEQPKKATLKLTGGEEEDSEKGEESVHSVKKLTPSNKKTFITGKEEEPSSSEEEEPEHLTETDEEDIFKLKTDGK